MSLQVASILVAAGVLLWVFRGDVWYVVESVIGRAFSDDHDHAPAKRRGPTYQAAMLNLADVRLRLVETSALSKDATEAVETLTLALLAGSDK